MLTTAANHLSEQTAFFYKAENFAFSGGSSSPKWREQRTNSTEQNLFQVLAWGSS